MAEKGKAVPVKRTPKQKAAQTRASQQQLDRANAQRLAQIVNLMISGYSIADIAAATGATPDEIERMLMNDVSRYVRTQPALRVYVRNFVSKKYTDLLDAVWDDATDKKSQRKYDGQIAAVRILERMTKLYGADAPSQTEIKVEAAPEAVEKMVSVLAQAQGLGYDMDIFNHDIVDGEVVHEAAEQAEAALEQSSEAVAEGPEEDL